MPQPDNPTSLPASAAALPGPVAEAVAAPVPLAVVAASAYEVPRRPTPPPLTSLDGRVSITADDVTVRGQRFLLLELERAELTPVRWVLWYLLGGLGLAAVMISFLQNWLHTLPAMAGMAATALLLAYGHRGTNRLRLFRLGRAMVNFALPGETAPWQRLTAELNRRIAAVHDHAAAEAAAQLAAADEAMRQAAQTAEAEAQANAAARGWTDPTHFPPTLS